MLDLILTNVVRNGLKIVPLKNVKEISKISGYFVLQNSLPKFYFYPHVCIPDLKEK